MLENTVENSQNKASEPFAGAPKKVALQTLGCRLNFSETGGIADQFVKAGYEIVQFGEPADVVFLNTCTVTEGADRSCRAEIRKARKTSPQAKVVVAGCYAQMEAEKLRQMPEVDLVLGNSQKYQVLDFLQQTPFAPVSPSSEIQQPSRNTQTKDLHTYIDKTNDFFGAVTSLAEGHTRAFLKIQDGCNYVCSFCIIPLARGRSRTITPEEALQSAKSTLAQGFKEIVITGVNIGEYEESAGVSLAELLRPILALHDLKRLRLSSLEPNTLNRELLSVLKESGKVMDHFHLPLQSGSDSILKLMRRKYTRALYQQQVQLVQEFFPEATFGADIMVGHPGETEELFLETFDFLRESPLTHFHVFPYSKRQSTTSAKLPQQVDPKTKQERVKLLLNLGQAKLQTWAEKQIGRRVEVLFESQKEGYWEGHAPQFCKVRLESPLAGQSLRNVMKTVSLNEWRGDYFSASLRV
jgi:threonylcarbamoyladenosine tRNA methylthiotransferase MtaB